MLILLGCLLAMLVFSASACAPSVGGTLTPVAQNPVASASPNPQAQSAIDAAVRDAATKLNVNPADVRVEQVEARDWSDASLGCPQPGSMYAQVITPGYLIVVSAGGKQLEYHTDQRGRAVLCSER